MQRPKRKSLLLVNLSKTWGGGEKWFFTVAKALQDRGHSVKLAVYPGSELENRVKNAGIPHLVFKARFLSLLNPLIVWSIYRKIKKNAPEVVIMNASHELKVIGLIAHWASVPHIIFRRGVSYPLKENPLNQWYVDNIITGFIANANATFEAFAKAFPSVRSKQHITIYNGVDVSEWNPPNVKHKEQLIGLTARLSYEKGIDRAIEAIAQLKKQGIKAHLLLMGDGPERKQLEQIVEQQELDDVVSFTGFVKDVRTRLAECSIFLFTPRWGEGTSLSLIEAMLLGLPCVVFDTASMNEVVINGETGFVIPDGDIIGLADHLQLLLTDDNLRITMGNAARKRAQMYFTLQRVVDDLEEWLGAL